MVVFNSTIKKYIYNPVSWWSSWSSWSSRLIHSNIILCSPVSLTLLTQLYNSHSISLVDIYIKLLPEGKGTMAETIKSDGGVVPPKAGESNLLRQDDVY